MSSGLKLGLVICLMAAGAAAEDQPSWNLAVFGGVNRHSVYGSTADYIVDANDFPVTPAHAPAMLGLAVGRGAGPILFELDACWTFPVSVRLTDPSDGDTVSLKTSHHVSLALNVVFSPVAGVIRPFASAGGGVDVVLAGDATYTTAYGYVIEVPAPKTADRFDPEAHAGAGLMVLIGPSLGFRGEARSVWVFDKPRTVRSLQITGGLFVRF
jgi:hypothetical protein